MPHSFPCSLLPAPCSLLPTPYSLFPKQQTLTTYYGDANRFNGKLYPAKNR
ncbi:hypothetical protein [Moorena producens]|uniref:hypothetical protein n=1 Tax=Moorena producens TaxID=1155739 RepID=UPI000AC0F759|nr:hypothetical protein [Moorena producens]